MLIAKGTATSAAVSSFPAHTSHCTLSRMDRVACIRSSCLRKESSVYPFSLVLLLFNSLFLKLAIKPRHVISSHIIEITTRNEKFNSVLVQGQPYQFLSFLCLRFS